jgi:hypothetical protein
VQQPFNPPLQPPAPEPELHAWQSAIRAQDDSFFDPFEDDVPTLRNINSAAPASTSLASSSAAVAKNTATPHERSSARTVVSFPALTNPTQREAQMHEIYQRFLETKQACGEAIESTTFERFLAKVEQNRQALLQQSGVKDVQFSVYIKDGKAALKAKVVRDGGT